MSTQRVSNDRAIVTEWRLATGSETGWHVHGHDYIVVPQTDGELLLEAKTGDRVSELRAGQSYAGLKDVCMACERLSAQRRCARLPACVIIAAAVTASMQAANKRRARP